MRDLLAFRGRQLQPKPAHTCILDTIAWIVQVMDRTVSVSAS
jgi:hypothetical protein